ncbi:MAG: DUF6492 family protein [Oleiphilaceae bacterium]|nr:DUF6492 family protein [Oleiphilaceae bacterium]
MSREATVVFITATWAGDLEHFRVMRHSLEQSPLARFEHHVIVQDEDLALFEAFRGRPGLKLYSTRDVLPPAVERRRVRARALSGRFGRNFTRICGSLKRVFSWPQWPSYTGWHTQQLCKFRLASELDCDTAVILDSDVVITPNAEVGDFLGARGPLCFADWQRRETLGGKVGNWVQESERLVGADHSADPVNVYFDTPFVLDRRLLNQALAHLESRTGQRWWSSLLERPPRRWSEFGFYKAFLMAKVPEGDLEWREPTFFRYVFDTSDPQKVIHQVRAMITDPGIHYITIHSQASGRENWDPQAYLKPLLSLLKDGV